MSLKSSWKNRRAVSWGVALACLMCLGIAPVADAQNLRLFQTTLDNSSGAFLGVSMQDVTAQNMKEYRLAEERGVIVRSVQKGSPAEAASIKEDDVILEFSGQRVTSSFQLSRLVKETPVGRKVALLVSRDGKHLTLDATLEAREPSRADNSSGNLDELLEPFRGFSRNFNSRPENPDQGRSGNRRERQEENERQSQNRQRLGVRAQALTGQMADYLGVPGKKGVLVASVASGSPSEGKLKAGDVIVSVDNDDIDSPEALTRAVRNASGQVTVKIVRDKKPASVSIDLPDGGKKDYRL